ncbi:MAG: ABC transporter ATP-binding protein [Planctomycetota bacterium]|jgi:iron complex transport system ATP-binding protein|nr:ABC transporter ATP-binding protein [Planctomycetota bacterium]
MDERQSTGPRLSVRDVRFKHGPQLVLDSVTLDFAPGRHYAVLGPNGAGKSTLLDLLSRLARPASGSILVEGRNISEYTPGGLARLVSLAPQECRLDFPFTIREVARMGRRPYLGRWGCLDVEDERAVERAIAGLHLGSIADKPVTALSGGERRRAVVARTVAQDAPIMLLDEPTSGLDVAQALSVMALMKRFAGEGRLVVTVSHDLDLAAAFCHEAVFLKAGRVAAAGPIGECFTPDILAAVYDAEAAVRPDPFLGGLSASFRPRKAENGS